MILWISVDKVGVWKSCLGEVCGKVIYKGRVGGLYAVRRVGELCAVRRAIAIA